MIGNDEGHLSENYEGYLSENIFPVINYLDKNRLVKYLSDSWYFKVWREENLEIFLLHNPNIVKYQTTNILCSVIP